jgi:hypothetical protein
VTANGTGTSRCSGMRSVRATKLALAILVGVTCLVAVAPSAHAQTSMTLSRSVVAPRGQFTMDVTLQRITLPLGTPLNQDYYVVGFFVGHDATVVDVLWANDRAQTTRFVRWSERPRAGGVDVFVSFIDGAVPSTGDLLSVTMRGNLTIDLNSFVEWAVNTRVGLLGSGRENLLVQRAPVSRVAGPDRIETAIEISKATTPSTDTVVLARADSFPDALTGGPLARRAGGVVLLTASSGLDGRVSAEIQRLFAGRSNTRIYLLGGSAVMSAAVESAVRPLATTVTRLGGADRYETSRLIATEARRLGADRAVAVADGQTFGDALCAGFWAASNVGTLVLTQGTVVPASTDAYLRERSAGTLTVFVGDAAANAGVFGAEGIRSLNPEHNCADLASIDFGTRLRGTKDVVGRWILATVGSFPDGLAAAAFGSPSSRLLLTQPSRMTAQLSALDPWVRASGPTPAGFVLGGPAAVSQPVYDEFRRLLR